MIENVKKSKFILIGIGLSLIGLSLQSYTNFVLPEKLRDTITLTLGIVYEALPFIFLGILLSVLIQRYVRTTFLYRLLPNQSWLRRPVLSVLGIFLPVCECGNIPLARGLMQKGLKPAEVLTFLFAAPIINPITIYTTSQAFQNDQSIVIIRVIAAFVIANLVGSLYVKSKSKELLTSDFQAYCDLHEHQHSSKDSVKEQLRSLSGNFREESARLLPSLIAGSALAGVIQTVIPRSILTAVSSEPVLAILAMLALAFIVSICANVDAFFALSLSGIFPVSAIIAFLVFGPMIDIKILTLLRTTFKPWVLLLTSVFIFILSFLTGLLVHYAL